MTAALERTSKELLQRLSTEDARPPETAGTHLVGGIVKAASKLEALLRQVVMEVEHLDLDDPLPGRSGRLRKATTGELAFYLRDRFPRPATIPTDAAVRPLIEDIVGARSRILAFVEMRNAIAKRDAEPRGAKAALRDLKTLVAGYRRRAGWPD